nr:MAG TPA: hypothetical protein [Bacteriophage sp.]DAN96846.1 MAG TPA: hypothetical protein [Caudoviricetes sp.]
MLDSYNFFQLWFNLWLNNITYVISKSTLN